MNKKVSIIILSTFIFILTGCSSVLVQIQPLNNMPSNLIKDGEFFGQTFYSKHNGLEGIRIFVEEVQKPGSLILNLYTSPDKLELLTSVKLSVSGEEKNQYLEFYIPTPIESYLKRFYFEIEVVDTSLKIGNSYPENYSSGSMYINHIPVENQLNFSLYYSPIFIIKSLMKQTLIWAYWLIIIFISFLLPGLIMVDILWKNQKTDVFDKLGLACGTSIAFYPLFFLITYSLGIKLFRWNLYVILIFSLIYLISKYLSKKKNLLKNNWFQLPKKEERYFIIGYIVILIGVIFSRFWSIRTLSVPLWGDSVQHSVLTQLFLDNGGLFNSWLPYAPYKSLTVHFGFSVIASIFSWATNYSSTYSTLVTGQIINIFSIMSIYPLAKKIGKSSWVGLFSMLIAGILSPMPAYYVNWGRFAQLAGQVILPVVIYIYWNIIEDQKKYNYKKSLLLVLVLVGMGLCYYRMPIYFAVFALILMFKGFFTEKSTRLVWWSRFILKNMIIIIAMIVLLIPWLINLSNSKLSGFVEGGITNEQSLLPIVTDYRSWLIVGEYIPYYLLVLFFISIVAAFYSKKWNVVILFLWSFLLSIFRALQIINFPAANMMQSFAVIIFLYIPISISIAWLINTSIGRVGRKLTNKIAFLIIIILLVPGVNNIRKNVNESKQAMMQVPDLFAMDWINQNITENALFLVEGYQIYDGASVIGADAGWYLPLFTRRANTMPPQYALLTEEPINENYSKEIVEIVAFLNEHSLSESKSFQMLCKNQITHIYIGQDQGYQNLGGYQLFSEDELKNNFYKKIYAEDRVRIYVINQDRCEF